MLDVCRENSRLANELNAAMAEVARSGAFVHGPACHKFEAEMAKYPRAEHAIGCASGSDALLLVSLALGIGPGDEKNHCAQLHVLCDGRVLFGGWCEAGVC